MKTLNLGGGSTAYMIGQVNDNMCRCGKPRLQGYGGCDDYMTNDLMIEYFIRNKRYHVLFDLQDKVQRTLFVVLDGVNYTIKDIVATLKHCNL